MTWVQTYTSRRVDLLNPTADMICLRDIAHALSHLCRFTGHTKTFYSVAEHSLWLTARVPIEHALAALMHDATEAYLGDVSTPLKTLLPNYQALERNLWHVIADKYGIDRILPECVKRLDAIALVTERRDLLEPCAHKWSDELERLRPAPDKIRPGRSPNDVSATFLRCADGLNLSGSD